VVWGPVDARHLPAFLDEKQDARMRQVAFDLPVRLEMAVMWAAPLSLLALITLAFWPAGLPGLVALIWGLALAVYLAFPLYERLVARGSLVGFVALFAGLTLAGVALTGTLTDHLTLPFLIRWSGLGIGVVLLLAIDLAGSTPLYKSWLHDDRRYRVALEAEQCITCGRCAQVCPRGVFVVEEVAALPHADRCEQCGACIVQCPTDALAFLSPSGERIPPETVRRYKLNLMGHRERPSA
jgi:ferredoxin